MIEQSNPIRHRCCFTGHRPEKLPHISEITAIELLTTAIWQAYHNGIYVFITGMSRGVDIWAGECVVKLKADHPEVKLVCALPFPEFDRTWATHWQSRYRVLLEHSDYTKIVSPSYSKECFFLRNKWMVNHAQHVIALYTGEEGGTRNTLLYAKQQNRSIYNVL